LSDLVWIFAEHKDSELLESSLEVICEGRRLADQLKAELSVILIGYQLEVSTETMARYGAETVFLFDHELCETFHPDLFADVLSGLVKVHNPDIFLFSATVAGEELAPRVAGKLRTILVPNCDKLAISDEGLLLQTRLTHQNKVHTTAVCPGARPQMVTLKQGITRIKELPDTEEMHIIKVDPTAYIHDESQRVKVTGFIKADPKTIDISDAELIVSGGKGAKDEKGFQLIGELADVMGASLAGSRVAVDNQWIDRSRQIGQSGKTVSPDLMLSCGISGASAHTFGIRETKTLIAINKDKAAPIMKLADLGVVGDLHEILPELIRRLKDSKDGK
jgi:electron transfer flavoprotein alpha subunit